MEAGEVFIAGKVQLIKKRDSVWRRYELDPHQTRQIFTHKGWRKVVGFHTRNVVHRAHEHLQLMALKRTGANGLFLSPVIGPKKSGDWLTGPIMKSYELAIGSGAYPKGKVVLGSFSTYSRYAGPREAVFTALCRKNMGCSHFIVGRDHTGVGDFYKPQETGEIFEKVGDLGIEPVFFEAVGFNPKKNEYVSLSEAGTVKMISGTQARRAFQEGKELPDWFMRKEIQEMVRERVGTGKKVFY